MKTIWKFFLSVADRQTIEMPVLAKVLDVQIQRNHLCIWAVVDDTNPLVKRTFHIAGTGHRLPADIGDYIGTFQLDGGALVFHLFDCLEPQYS